MALTDNVPSGSLRFNTDSSKLEIYNGEAWWTIDGSAAPGASRSLFAGGEAGPASVNTITYVQTMTTGNSLDFGDLTDTGDSSGNSSRTRGLFFMNNPDRQSVDYVNMQSTGNGTDWGNLNVAVWMRGSASDGTRALWAGGLYPGSSTHADISYVTIESNGYAADFGDLATTATNKEGTNSTTRACFGGGADNSAPLNSIEYVTISTLGNGVDFGDLTDDLRGALTSSSPTRGVFAGGKDVDSPSNNYFTHIEYITFTTLGNASDFGDITVGRAGGSTQTGNAVRGVFGGGYNPSGKSDVIDYITMTSLGNASDFGNLTIATQYNAGCCSGHGGIK
tara:strand:- start:30 stop:1037 length:1008 start_codon:yes stop_codon:yes gene_type:complete